MAGRSTPPRLRNHYEVLPITARKKVRDIKAHTRMMVCCAHSPSRSYFCMMLTVFWCSLIVIATFLVWEFVAWFTHKYIMHGILWTWHKSHHTRHDHALERNDLFAVVFSIPSIFLFYYGTLVSYNPYLLAMGLGILCYGIFYIVFHDVIVHQRLKWRPNSRSRYLERMIHAHYVHHSRHTKEGCEAFGFLYAPKKYEPGKFVMREKRKETQ